MVEHRDCRWVKVVYKRCGDCEGWRTSHGERYWSEVGHCKTRGIATASRYYGCEEYKDRVTHKEGD